MKLPRALASTPPPSTGLVRADPRALTDTGDAGFGALSRLGGAISNVAGMGFDALMKRKALDNQAAAGRANARSVDSLNEMTNAIKGLDISQNMVFPDTPKEYYSGETGDLIELPTEDVIKFREEQIAKHNGRLETLSKAMGFKGEAARLAWLEGKKNSDRETITKVSNKAQNDFQTKLYLGNAENAATNGDIETANEWIEIAERSGLVGAKKAAKERKDNSVIAVESEVVGLYRTGLHDEAKKVLEASSVLTAKEKEKLDDEIDIDKRQADVAFESRMNQFLIDIDNTEGMTQRDFNEQAKSVEIHILAADVDGTKRKRMLEGLEKWRRGTSETDYAKILSLNQEMDAAQRSGIVDPTIGNRITQANMDGSFGGRHKGGQKTYADLVRRFEKLQFDERMQSISPIVRTFERENADDPRLIFLFHQAKNKLISDKPDAGTKEIFIETSALAEAYSILSERTIERKMKTKEAVEMIAPDGSRWNVPMDKKQRFLDNGYKE